MYEIIVSNVGRVYEGNSAREAQKAFKDYKEMSISGHGRVGGETVDMYLDGEIVASYSPPTNPLDY